MFRTYVVLAILYQCFVNLKTWDISNSNRNDVILRHVSLYYLRAFLCVKSTTNATIPTLLESTWPENVFVVKPRIYPSSSKHVGHDRKDCEKIQQARATDVDGNGFLWVLDVGNEYCPVKIIIFDLENKNVEILRSSLVEYSDNEFVSIKVNPYTIGTADHMAYITTTKGQFLMAFFFNTSKWQKIQVRSGDDSSDDQVYPTDIAFTLDKRLYMADQSGNLFVTDTMNTANSSEIKSNHLGVLLDRPRGLITDENGHLYYIIPRFGAVVRWNPTRTLNAEGHDVLKFHTNSIIQILFGVRGSVWIAMEKMSTMRDHCIRIMYHFSTNAIL